MVLTVFVKRPNLRCLTGFCIRLCNIIVEYVIMFNQDDGLPIISKINRAPKVLPGFINLFRTKLTGGF